MTTGSASGVTSSAPSPSRRRPRRGASRSSAWDDYAFLWYPRRPPYEMPTHPRRAFRFAAPDSWEWLTRAAPRRPPRRPAGSG
jgi:hypothetical protein